MRPRRRRPAGRAVRRASLLLIVAGTPTACVGAGDDESAEAGRPPRAEVVGETAEDRETAHPSAPVTFVDAAGRRHRLEEPARRIVSLVPSATETLHALGSHHRLVGVTDYDDRPWADTLPSVGGGLEPNLEALLALRPDAVIRFEGEQDPRTPARLDQLGIRHVAVRPVSLDDLYETNRILGALTGRTEAADSLSEAIRSGLQDLSRAVAPLPRKRVAYVLGGSPPWVAGPETYVSEILSLVGGDNVFADLERPYAPVSPEELRSRAVDVVLVGAEGTYDASLTPEARVEAVGESLDAPGPDVVAGAREVAEVVHGREIR